MSLRTFSHGTVMWMPLAGRMLPACAPSSRARTSSAHTPVAFTTTRARTSTSPDPVSTTAPATRSPARTRRTTAAWLTTVAPWSSAAVRASVRVSRASSAWAS